MIWMKFPASVMTLAQIQTLDVQNSLTSLNVSKIMENSALGFILYCSPLLKICFGPANQRVMSHLFNPQRAGPDLDSDSAP